jgi:hypothetical protein
MFNSITYKLAIVFTTDGNENIALIKNISENGVIQYFEPVKGNVQ